MRSDAQRNRDAIVDAYLALGGREEPSMDEVAARAEVRRSTLYRHFGDREGLRRAAVARVLDETAAALAASLAPELPVERALQALVDAGVALAPRLRAISAGQDYADRQLMRRWTALSRPLVRFLRERQDGGELRADVPAELLADAFFALLDVCQFNDGRGGPSARATGLPLFLAGAAAPLAPP